MEPEAPMHRHHSRGVVRGGNAPFHPISTSINGTKNTTTSMWYSETGNNSAWKRAMQIPNVLTTDDKVGGLKLSKANKLSAKILWKKVVFYQRFMMANDKQCLHAWIVEKLQESNENNFVVLLEIKKKYNSDVTSSAIGNVICQIFKNVKIKIDCRLDFDRRLTSSLRFVYIIRMFLNLSSVVSTFGIWRAFKQSYSPFQNTT